MDCSWGRASWSSFSFRNTTFIGQDGRGNVALAVDGASGTGALAATFEYSPFGEIARMTTTNTMGGQVAGFLPFRYQNKYALQSYAGGYSMLAYEQMLGSELYDFGRRVYAPEHGRFISRDPIGHAGGLNLYAYVGNQVPNAWDFLGMSAFGPEVTMQDGYATQGVYAQLAMSGYIDPAAVIAIGRAIANAREYAEEQRRKEEERERRDFQFDGTFPYDNVASIGSPSQPSSPSDEDVVELPTHTVNGSVPDWVIVGNDPRLAAMAFSYLSRFYPSMRDNPFWQQRRQQRGGSLSNADLKDFERHIFEPGQDALPYDRRTYLPGILPFWDSFYRWLYTGNGNIGDALFADAALALGKFLVEEGGVRGAGLSGSWKPIEWTLPNGHRISLSVAVSIAVTMDDGIMIGAGGNAAYAIPGKGDFVVSAGGRGLTGGVTDTHGGRFEAFSGVGGRGNVPRGTGTGQLTTGFDGLVSNEMLGFGLTQSNGPLRVGMGIIYDPTRMANNIDAALTIIQRPRP